MSPCLFLGLFAVYLQAAGAVTTNGVPYDQMPPLTAVDAYAPCMRARGDFYCFVSAKLCGDASHPLYNALLEYSANNFTRFDRTNVHRGICLKKTCHEFVNTSPNLTTLLETCLNETLGRAYGLTGRVLRTLCSEYQDGVKFDASDYAFGAVVLALLGLNVIGSLCDFCGSGEDTIVGRSLLCFSVRRNWQKLTTSPSHKPGQRRLLGLTVQRSILSFAVIATHTGMGKFYTAGNPDHLEKTFNHAVYMAWYGGLEILQLTFVTSGLLLAYNVQKSEEHATWKNGHKALLWRWLRLTPVYAFMIFFISTWARHVSEGPFWRAIVELEANDCRRDWWYHLLYIHNYIDNSRCMIYSWSMAVDMQLTVVGVGIFFLLKSERARKAAIALLLAVGIVATAAAIYFNNLQPILISSPEVIRNWFVYDPTFNYLYKRGHTNLICYGLGLALGFVVYNLKEEVLGVEKYKKYRVVHWLLIPGVLALQLTGSVFYDPELVVPLPIRLFYSSTVRLISGVLMSSHIYLTAVKADGVRTKIFTWRCWLPLSRLSFCVYMLHFIMIRIRDGALDTTIDTSKYLFLRSTLENIVMSFLFALPLFLLVEAPIGNITGLFFGTREKKSTE